MKKTLNRKAYSSRMMIKVNTVPISIKSKPLLKDMICRLLRIRKDQKGKPLKRTMLGSVEDFIDSYRKKSPSNFAM